MKTLRVMLLTALLVLPSVSGLAQEQEWSFAGWYGGGMYPALAPDPTVEGRLYVASDVAGIWRSDDRGDNWYFINQGLDNLNVSALAVSSDGGHVYAGTQNSFLHSEDGGSTWNAGKKLPEIAFQKSARSIFVDPQNGLNVYVGTKAGEVFFSGDAGAHWMQLGSNPFGEKTPLMAVLAGKDGETVLAFSKLGGRRYDAKTKTWTPLTGLEGEPADALWDPQRNMLWVAVGNKLAMSADQGATWKFSSPLPKGTILRMALETKDGKTRAIVGWKDNWKGGVYLSDDEGKSWKDAVGETVHDAVSDPTRQWMKGFSRSNALQIDPFNADIFYYTDSWGIWRTDDAGLTWHEKIKGAPNTSGSDLSIDEEGNIFVATMDDGLLLSKDAGKKYQPVLPTEGFVKNISGHVWRVLSQPKSGRIVATASPWHEKTNRVFWSDDRGKTFTAASGLPVDRPKKNTMWGSGYPRALTADPFDENRLYLGIDGDDGGGFFVSSDGGKNWQRTIHQPGSLRVYNGLATDPTRKDRLVWGACGKGGGVYRTEDGGESWENVLPKMSWVFDVRFSKSGKIFAAGADGKPAIYASSDHGNSWKCLYHADFADAMDALAVDPSNEDHLYAGLVSWGEKAAGRVLYSPDGGMTWKDITGSLPDSTGPAANVFDPREGYLYTLLYAGSVYKTKIEAD